MSVDSKVCLNSGTYVFDVSGTKVTNYKGSNLPLSIKYEQARYDPAVRQLASHEKGN